MTTTFADRQEAGAMLADRLAGMDLVDPVVLGLPRGGVVVAAEVARLLGVPVEVFVARKIGHPHHEEFGVGAVAEGGEAVYDQAALRHTGLTPPDLQPVEAAERAELTRRVRAYRGDRELPDLAGRCVVVVDDGIATGVTTRAALRALRRRHPGRLVLAAPVGAADSVRDLSTEADEVVVLHAPHHFVAVGRWYRSFRQTTDDEVLALLPSPP
jgi:putative phosphoribosyl transferase